MIRPVSILRLQLNGTNQTNPVHGKDLVSDITRYESNRSVPSKRGLTLVKLDNDPLHSRSYVVVRVILKRL